MKARRHALGIRRLWLDLSHAGSPGTVTEEVCHRDGCTGRIREPSIEGCTCFQSAPCNACLVRPEVECSICDWNSNEDDSYYD